MKIQNIYSSDVWLYTNEYIAGGCENPKYFQNYIDELLVKRVKSFQKEEIENEELKNALILAEDQLKLKPDGGINQIVETKKKRVFIIVGT